VRAKQGHTQNEQSKKEIKHRQNKHTDAANTGNSMSSPLELARVELALHNTTKPQIFSL
jgi:hypothetical protein